MQGLESPASASAAPELPQNVQSPADIGRSWPCTISTREQASAVNAPAEEFKGTCFYDEKGEIRYWIAHWWTCWMSITGQFECGPDPKERDIVGYPAVLKQQQDYNGWLRSHYSSSYWPAAIPGQVPETGELDKGTLLSRFIMAEGEIADLKDFLSWDCARGTKLLNSWVSTHYSEWRKDPRSEGDSSTRNGICDDVEVSNDRFQELQRILISISPYADAAAAAESRARKLVEANYVAGPMPPELSAALAPITAAMRDDLRKADALNARAEKIEDALQSEIEANRSAWTKKFEDDHSHDQSITH
ncbi:MAG: hypothetical protein KGJ84_13040 [Elusimicrobia bacterium]|nr:hypothetical protein [Elusimicrobiota bacterium]